MRQHLAFFGTVAGLAVVVFGSVPHSVAGAATPPATNIAAISKELLGQGTSAVAPDRALILQQRTFAPGSDSGAHPAAGPTVLYVNAGEVKFTVTDGAALLSRQGGNEQEPVAAGDEVELYRGDAVFYDEGVVHDVANPNAESAVTLEARLNPVEELTSPTP
jgi:mannose-6-phosphate isomerase-like protein (cupin superfamily)